MLTTVEDDAEMELVPALAGESPLEVALGLDDVFPRGQFPALGEAVNVGIDGESGYTEGLAHDDGGGFVSDPGKSLQRRKIGGNLPAVFFDENLRKFGNGD